VRTHIATLLVGVAVGATVALSICFLLPRPHDEAQRAIDYLIDEWTVQRYDATFQLAQVANQHGFRLRHIPDTVRALAGAIEVRYGVPSAVTISQFILESRWGLSDLGANNLFGHTIGAVRRFMEQPDSVLSRDRVMSGDSIVTGKPRWFARYRNLAESFDVHGKYLRHSARYAAAFRQGNSESFVRALAEAGYAEDPEYGLKLVAIMKRYNL
jgi:flagellum-specific peptidoglycan hydrolase FlgJ